MDDFDSVIYYLVWNQCIFEVLKCFNLDIYYINDFYGVFVLLYLFFCVILCCFFFYNVEFQGMWSFGMKEEKEEVCKVFNLDQKVVE